MADEERHEDERCERRAGHQIVHEEAPHVDPAAPAVAHIEAADERVEHYMPDPLMDQLLHEGAILNRKARGVARLAGAWAVVCGLYALALSLMLLTHILPSVWLLLCTPLLAVPLLVLMRIMLPSRAKLRRMKRALQDLTESEDPRALMTLAAALPRNEVEQSRLILALTRLLPRLQPTDASLLPSITQVYLHPMLDPEQTEEHAAFQIAILTALGKVGDPAALPYVQRLADMEPLTPAHERVRQAARECLVTLPVWAERRRTGDTLVRAFLPPGAPADTFLRPARGGEQIDSDQLLRSSAPDESQPR